LDPEEELNEAFGSFDEGDEGVVRVEEMREWLKTTGDRMSEEEVNVGQCWHGPLTHTQRMRSLTSTSFRFACACRHGQIDKLFESRFTDKRKGLFNYREFSKVRGLPSFGFFARFRFDRSLISHVSGLIVLLLSLSK
jgi:hypothetical protein